MDIKKRTLYIAGIILIIAIFTISSIMLMYSTGKKSGPKDIPVKPATAPSHGTQEGWYVDSDGFLYYPQNRGNVSFRRDNYVNENYFNDTSNLDVLVSTVVYQSSDADIYALLTLPQATETEIPAVIFIPGSGQTKETRLSLAAQLSSVGIAVLVLDMRGVGETKETVGTLDDDFALFMQDREPAQHKMVYDVLRAVDVLRAAPFIDSERIVIAGEGFGGRFAVISTAIDPTIAGVISISSSGFGFTDKGDLNKDQFLKSIDSDHYIGSISPRKTVLIHNANDTVVPLNAAIASYEYAKPPRQLMITNDSACPYGYCQSMYPALFDALYYLNITIEK